MRKKFPRIEKSVLQSSLKNGCSIFFEYETPKILTISSIKVGLINVFIQFIIIGYIVGWVMIYEKGYQDSDEVVSAVVTKVKGISLTKDENGIERLWDVADYIVPPQEKDAVFITTKAIITDKQVQGKCPENPTIPGALCKVDSDCQPNDTDMLGNGVKTGRCVDTEYPNNKIPTKTCEIFAWCPVEMKVKSGPMLRNVDNFTLLIKNSIAFNKFNVQRTNVIDSKRLTTCHFDPVNDTDCPVMSIFTILKEAETTYDNIGFKGGVIGINIDWQCNLDFDVRLCKPTYKFHRLDDQKTKYASGWNFRHASYYVENGTEYRTLIKAFGIRLIIYVTGKAGKFDVIPFTMNLGSGLALLGIATFFCDMIVLYCLDRQDIYREAKYETIVEEEVFKVKKENKSVPTDEGVLTTPNQ